ncbi:MAG: O-antigen translocase [Acidobacteriota bacterium]
MSHLNAYPPAEGVPAAMPSNSPHMGSYGQILKSSSIIGGAQALNLLVGMIKTKLVAILLGPAGVGLVGLYQSATTLVGTFAGLGITSSAVRQVAEAAGSEDDQGIGRTVVVLRRACWFSGVLGTLLTAVLAWPLSVWAFGNGERAWPIAVLGLTLLLSSISGGQMALIQGVRRISDLARLQILSVIAGTILSVGLFAWLGEQGIVPVLVVSAAINLGLSWWFARRVHVPIVKMTWPETIKEARHLLTLGLGFMWSALLMAGVGLAARALVVRDFGIDANGIYQAAWGVSGVFAGFILTAMGTDFYPRLTAAAGDNAEVNRLVNEQSEVGILLALPGLLGTLVFSPLVIRIFYSAKFMDAADLLPWFVLGIFGRVISWPLGFIQLARSAVRWFIITETSFNFLYLVLIWVGAGWIGLRGTAIAFAIVYGVYTLGMTWVAGRISQFRWSKAVLRLFLTAGLAVAVTFGLVTIAPRIVAELAGAVIVIASTFFCIRQILHRLGPQHRITQIISRLPVIGHLLAR